MSERNGLPDRWELTTLDKVVSPLRISVQPTDRPELSYIGMEHVEPETMRLVGTGSAEQMKSNALLFRAGDVLYGRLRPYLNKVYRPNFEGLCSAEFIIFPESPGVDNRYLQYFLNSWSFKRFASHLNTGDRPRVDWDQLKGYGFPLPPLSEQHRIVAAIEEQFSRLDAGVSVLERVRASLRRYRTAVLKAAVEGRLTEAWREENPDVEPASSLLKNILEERSDKWEKDQLAAYDKKDKKPPKNWRSKYKEPASPDTSKLPALPDGWEWATLTMLCTSIGDVDHKMPKGQAEGVPYISTKDFFPNRGINFDTAKLIAIEDYERLCRKIAPERNDILMSRYGTVGEVRLVDTEQPFQASYSIAIIKPASHSISKYLALALQG